MKLLFKRNLISTLAAVAIFTVTLSVSNSSFNTAEAATPSGKACPEGFSLNRGVCQAEPEYSCQYLLDQGYPSLRISLTDDGQCRIQHTNGPYCVQGFYDIWDNQCEDPVSFDGKFATENQEMYCSEEGFGGELMMTESTGNRWQCVVYEFEQAEPTCDTGTLNEKSGMCEVRPGNRNSRN